MKVKLIVLLAFLLLSAAPSSGAVFLTYPLSWDVGQAFAVSIASDASFDSPSATWLGRTVSLDVESQGKNLISYGLLGSFARDVQPGEYPVVFAYRREGNFSEVKRMVRLTPHKYPEESLKVSPKMVFPDKKELPRIKKEAALAGAAKKTMTEKRLWTTPSVSPVSGIVTSSYGFRRVYNGVPKGCHAGTDFRAAVGTPVASPFSGRVILTGDHYYAGKSVYVDSGNGVISMFFHLSEILVKDGDFVQKGKTLAKSGATGRITGPHLHYGLCLSGQYVDSVPLFTTTVTALLNGLHREKLED